MLPMLLSNRLPFELGTLLRSRVLNQFGAHGYLLDTSDRRTLWQDVAATLPLTELGQSAAAIDSVIGAVRYTQPTPAKRGVWSRRPATGPRQMFNNSAWRGAMPTGGWTRPQGSSDGLSFPVGEIDGAVIYRQEAVAQRPFFNKFENFVAGVTYTTSVYVRLIEGNASVRTANRIVTTASAAVLGASSSWTWRYGGASITPTTALPTGSEGWLEATFVPIASGNAGLRIGIGGAAEQTGIIEMSRPSLELGGSRNAWQDRSTAYDITEPGVRDVYDLMFDGVDDSYATAAVVPLGGSNKAAVGAGLYALRTDVQQVIVESGPNRSGVTQAFSMLFPGPTASRANFGARGSGDSYPAAELPHGNQRAVTAIGHTDIAAPLITLTFNGAEASSSSSQGGGIYAARVHYLGARNDSSSFFAGYMGALCVNPRLLTSAETVALSAWLDYRCGRSHQHV